MPTIIKSKRVHNLKVKGTGAQEYVCTVCRKERT